MKKQILSRQYQVAGVMRYASLYGEVRLTQLREIVDQPSYLLNHLVELGYMAKTGWGVYKWLTPIKWATIDDVALTIATSWRKSVLRKKDTSLLEQFSSKDLLAELNRRGFRFKQI